MPVRHDDGDWIPVEKIEDWDVLLGSAENLRARDREAALRRSFGMAGLVAVLCVSAWSVASQVYPPAGSEHLVASSVASENVEVDAETEVPEEHGGEEHGGVSGLRRASKRCCRCSRAAPSVFSYMGAMFPSRWS